MNKRVKNAPNLIKVYNIDFFKQNFDILKYSVFIKIKTIYTETSSVIILSSMDEISV